MEAADAAKDLHATDAALAALSAAGGDLRALAALAERTEDRAELTVRLASLGCHTLGHRHRAIAALLGRPRLPLAIIAEGGLGNKLRVTLSYRLRARAAGRPLEVTWAPSDECPALN